MKKFEDILSNFCGCVGSVFDEQTGRLTEPGEKAYDQLKKMIEALGELKVINAVGAEQKLEDIVNANRELYGNWIYKDHPIYRIAKATIGKELHTYDSWIGCSTTILITNIELRPKSVLFIGYNTRVLSGKSKIYVDLDYLEELLNTGYAEKHQEIEGCHSKITWELSCENQ